MGPWPRSGGSRGRSRPDWQLAALASCPTPRHRLAAAAGDSVARPAAAAARRAAPQSPGSPAACPRCSRRAATCQPPRDLTVGPAAPPTRGIARYGRALPRASSACGVGLSVTAPAGAAAHALVGRGSGRAPNLPAGTKMESRLIFESSWRRFEEKWGSVSAWGIGPASCASIRGALQSHTHTHSPGLCSGRRQLADGHGSALLVAAAACSVAPHDCSSAQDTAPSLPPVAGPPPPIPQPQDFRVPREIVWLLGAPGAGKVWPALAVKCRSNPCVWTQILAAQQRVCAAFAAVPHPYPQLPQTPLPPNYTARGSTRGTS
jgi:hypothetical protein